MERRIMAHKLAALSDPQHHWCGSNGCGVSRNPCFSFYPARPFWGEASRANP